MQAESDAVSELDLDAYVDEQLDDWQRLRVEDYLARHPEAAARVMQDIRLKRELRLALAPTTPTTGPQRAGASRLARGLRRDERLRRAVRLVPVAALVVTGWLANEGFGPLHVGQVVASQPAPPVVAAALSARDASLVRLAMHSQPQVPELDTAELRAATGILLPVFDGDWTIRDAQVFPSPQGPGIEVVFDAGELGQLTHFAVRTGSFAVTMPHVESRGDRHVAWFQIGETAHVMIADRGDDALLLGEAERLSSTLY